MATMSPRWLSARAASTAQLSCPCCAARVLPRPVLEVPTARGEWLRLSACGACGAHVFEGIEAGDYANDPPGGGAALAFYLQQGANMGGMAVRLAALGRPPGSRYLEIGCGFGIGLDIARRMLGWEALGLDPSPFAASGRELLGLPIVPRYLEPDDFAAGGFDVIHASEVLEHVADPLAMLRLLRRALRRDGTLVLTTPAAEMIRPETGEGLLIPLLSAGWHMVIQSEASLAILLRRAGFDEARVTREGAQLVAIAGPPPREETREGARAPYLAWLAAASGAVPATSDLGLGLRARLFREHSAAGHAAAAPAWEDLDAAVTARFGRGIEDFGAGAAAMPLEELAASEPLCLAGVLLHRGLEKLQRNEPAAPLLHAALAAARRLREALRAIGSDDGDAEEVEFVAARELAVIAAQAGEGGIAARLEALMAAGGSRHAEIAVRRCFVDLVNRGALEEARRIAAAMPAGWWDIEEQNAMSHADASLAFCRAVMELQLPDGRRREAVEALRRLRSALLLGFAGGDTETAATLYWPATEAAALGLRLLGEADAATVLIRGAEAQAARLAGFPARPVA